MPKDEWQPKRREEIGRFAQDIEHNPHHPNRFAASAGPESTSQLEGKRLKEMVGRFNVPAGGQEAGNLSGDFMAAPLVDKLFRPVLPELADAIKDRKPHEGVSYSGTKEMNVTVTPSDFLKLAAQHGYNPSQKIEIKGALADEWKALGGGSGMIKS